MYGKDYLDWKEAEEAWEQLHSLLEAKLADIDEEIRPAVMRKLRAEYEIHNVDTSLLARQYQQSLPALCAPSPFGDPPSRGSGLFGGVFI